MQEKYSARTGWLSVRKLLGHVLNTKILIELSEFFHNQPLLVDQSGSPRLHALSPGCY